MIWRIATSAGIESESKVDKYKKKEYISQSSLSLFIVIVCQSSPRLSFTFSVSLAINYQAQSLSDNLM